MSVIETKVKHLLTPILQFYIFIKLFGLLNRRGSIMTDTILFYMVVRYLSYMHDKSAELLAPHIPDMGACNQTEHILFFLLPCHWCAVSIDFAND